MGDNKGKTLSQLFSDNPRKLIRMISVAVIISACIIIAFYFVIARYSGFTEGLHKVGLILQPFTIGFCMAFLMNPIMKLIERPMNDKLLAKSSNPAKTRRAVRIFASIMSLIILLAIIVLIIVLIVPDIIATVKDISGSFGDKFTSMLNQINKLTKYYFDEQIKELKESEVSAILQSGFWWIVTYFNLDDKSALGSIATGAVTVGRFFVNALVGIFVSIYVLVSKDIFRGQLKKLIYGTFSIDKANWLLKLGRKTNDIFYGFIIGKIIDSIIIGIICYIGCLILKMPYAVLVSVIVGVTNIIPVFGPYIGAIPTFIIIFITEPIKGLIFLVFILALQQLDGNVIGPKILGESTGISVFWVVVGIVVGGGLFGVFGMLLGVPTMAVVYYIVGDLSSRRAIRRGLPEETGKYIELNSIDEESKDFIMGSSDKPKREGKKSLGALLQRGKKAKPNDNKNDEPDTGSDD